MRDNKIKEKLSSREWVDYCELMRVRQSAFADGVLKIITDIDEVVSFEETTGTKIGVIYRSAYTILVVDLVCDTLGRRFAYERILPAVDGGAVVCMTIHNGKYVLLRQFRHSLRGEQLSFPRGYGEVGISSEDNVRKEIAEELGAETKGIQFLGSVVPDSGLSGSSAAVYKCEIGDYKITSGYEGITDVVELGEDELDFFVRDGKITDGFTLSALALKRHMLDR